VSRSSALDPRILGAVMHNPQSALRSAMSLGLAIGRIRKATRELRQTLGRDASDDEIAERLGVTVAEYLRRQGIRRGGMLDEFTSPFLDQEHALELSERNTLIAQALDRLPPRHRTAVVAYFAEDQTQLEIGRRLGVTESRVCQILSEVLPKLRSALSELE
jgi:RNA polymerase sigma factor for flagellar operon FliA